MHRHGTSTSVSHASTTPGPDLFLDGAPHSSQSPPGSQSVSSSQPSSQPAAASDVLVEGFNYHAVLPAEDGQIQVLYQAAAEEEPRSPHPLEADYTSPCQYYTADVRGAFFVARQRPTGTIVGVCGLRAAKRFETQHPAGLTVAELRRLFVHPDWRGRGVGRQLLQEAVYEASRLAYGQVLASVPASQQAALSLLGKCGFGARAANDGYLWLDLNAL